MLIHQKLAIASRDSSGPNVRVNTRLEQCPFESYSSLTTLKDRKNQYAQNNVIRSHHLHCRKELWPGKAMAYNTLDIDILVFGRAPELQ